MKRKQMDEAISALKVAPVQTLGASVSAVAWLYLFCTDSEWWGTAAIVALIFMGLLWMASPGIIEVASQRANPSDIGARRGQPIP